MENVATRDGAKTKRRRGSSALAVLLTFLSVAAVVLAVFPTTSGAFVRPLCNLGPATNTGAPTISPTSNVVNGTTLSTTNGTWSSCSGITSYQYQWRKSDGSTNTVISGATSSSYLTTSSDAGYTITSAVAACNSDGCSGYVASSNSAFVNPSVDGNEQTSLDSSTVDPQENKAPCWTHTWKKKWGTWPYEQRVFLHTHWCGTAPGGLITARNSWITTESTICSSHDFFTHVIAGGVGWPTMTIEGGAYFDCNTIIPWFTIHKTRSFSIVYSAGGGSWVP
jgi:hypothetical protein